MLAAYASAISADDPLSGLAVGERPPPRTLLSEKFDGTLAELVAVPRRNFVPKPKPSELSFEEAACLPSAWLTAGLPACSCRWRDPIRGAPSWPRGRTAECPAH